MLRTPTFESRWYCAWRALPAQRSTIRSELSEYRCPCTLMCETVYDLTEIGLG